MLIRSKKSCFASKINEEEGKEEQVLRKQHSSVTQRRAARCTSQQLNKDRDSFSKQHRRPCISIAFPTLKCDCKEDSTECQYHQGEKKYYPHLSSSYDTATTCKLTVGGEESADGTVPTTATTANAAEDYYEPPLPWRSRSRSLSSVSSVSLSSVFSMDYTLDNLDKDGVYFDRRHRRHTYRASHQADCWNIHSLLKDVWSELCVSFHRRSTAR